MFRLFERVLAARDGFLGILSIIGRQSIPGCIVIETTDAATIVPLCEGFSNIYLRDYHRIASNDVEGYFRETQQYVPTPFHWIRLRHSRYRGDIALVHSVDKQTMRAEIMVVPRIALSQPKQSRKGKHRAVERPLQGLFHSDTIRAVFGPNSVQETNGVFLFRKETFIDGYHRFWCDGPFTQGLPSREEVLHFQKSTHLPPHFIQQQLNLIHARRLQVGDSIKVTAGNTAGLVGIVASLTETDVDMAITNDQAHLSVPLAAVRKNVVVSDYVLIIAGPRTGFVGWVIVVSENMVTICNADDAEEVSDC